MRGSIAIMLGSQSLLLPIFLVSLIVDSLRQGNYDDI